MLIRSKLSLAFGVIGALICGTGAIAIVTNLEIETDVRQVIQGSVEKPKMAEEMSEALRNIRQRGQEWETPSGRTTTNDAPSQKIVGALGQDVEQFERALTLVHEISERAVQLAVSEGAPAEIKSAEADVVLVDEIRNQFTEFRKLFERQTNNSLGSFGVESLRGWRTQHDALTTLVHSYNVSAQGQLRAEVKEIHESLGDANHIILWSTIAILLLAGLMAWFLARSFSRPLNLLSIAARRAGEGHFDTIVAIDSKDEFGLLAQAFNRMTNGLQASSEVDRIFKSMLSSLIVVRTDCTIKSVNIPTLEMLGYTEAELIGQPLERVLQTPGTDVKSILNEASKNGLEDVEFVYQTKEQLSIPVRFSASVLRDTVGAMSGLVCVAQDITDRKRVEFELEKTHKQLQDTSRRGGMAEIATNVLHNVGNVLNSVNISTSLLLERVKKSRASSLVKVAALLRDHSHDLGEFLTKDPKGKNVPALLTQLSEQFIADQRAVVIELDSLIENVEHIKEIVAMQQTYATFGGVKEVVSLINLVEESLRLNEGALTRHRVKIIRDFQDVPPVNIEKNKILQILVNLLRNAKHACQDSDRPDKQMTVRLANGDGRVRISVTDNGVGIPAENLTRIFNHGFTTRKDGHGFGLHSGALAATDLGGSLTVHSDGPGCGAAFTLELPCPKLGEL